MHRLAVDDSDALSASRCKAPAEPQDLSDDIALLQSLHEEPSPETDARTLGPDPGIEPFSQIRFKPSTRKFDPNDTRRLANGSDFRSIKDLHHLCGNHDWDTTRWTTIGVLVKKMRSNTNNRDGSPFHVWEISDIECGGQAHSFTLFLFGGAADVAWREKEGNLLLIVHPTRWGNESQQHGPTFKVTQVGQIRCIGIATEYGQCTFQGKGWYAPCRRWINRAGGSVCARCSQLQAKLQQNAAAHVESVPRVSSKLPARGFG